MTHALSVVIPAHNEAAVISRLLSRLVSGPGADALEIVVVPNGCTDDTAERAAAAGPQVRVSSISTGSKIAALREGDRIATTFPRAYVDADVEIDTETLLALAEALGRPDGPLVASPTLVVDTSGASWPTRQHFKIWELTDYRREGHIGSGVYAVSERGRARFTDWPEVIADDRFIQQLFRSAERLTLPDHIFIVRSPRTLRAQIARATRIHRGNLELPDDLQVADRPAAGRLAGLIDRVVRRPDLWLAFPIYLAGVAIAKHRARSEIRRRSPRDWHRDNTTRSTSE